MYAQAHQTPSWKELEALIGYHLFPHLAASVLSCGVQHREWVRPPGNTARINYSAHQGSCNEADSTLSLSVHFRELLGQV